MTKSFKIFLVVIVVSVLELSFLSHWNNRYSLHGPIRDMSYRRDERMAAVYADHEHPTPATKATLEAELGLMHKHLKLSQEVVWGILFVIDGVGIYYLWKYGRNKTVA